MYHPELTEARRNRIMLSIIQVAQRLGVSYWTVRRWVLSGDIAAVKLGSQWRVEEAEVDKFINRQQVARVK